MHDFVRCSCDINNDSKVVYYDYSIVDNYYTKADNDNKYVLYTGSIVDVCLTLL